MLNLCKDIARRVLGPIVIGASVCAMAGAAVAGVAETAPSMPIGAVASAPAGFLDFCRRSPSDCAPARVGSEGMALDDVRARAASLYWAGVFAAPRGEATRMTASIDAPGFDWSRVFPSRPVAAPVADPMRDGLAVAVEDVAVPAVATAVLSVAEGAASAADSGVDVAAVVAETPVEPTPVLVMDRARWKQLRAVNRDVNRAIRRGSDDRVHGVADFWNAPQGRDARGDCEDYVLAKRRALIDAGFAAETLSIAIVTTAWGESHAVLLAATDEGEMVLDNLTPRISRWDRVDYRWGERQAPGKVFDWVRMAG